jgi:hypothetical protein
MRRQSAIFLVRLLHDTLAFPRDQVDQLLIACHRRCCVCHRFCGVKIETDHIVTKADGGPDTIMRFRCALNITRRFTATTTNIPEAASFALKELRGHKEQWLEICRNKPEIFVSANRDYDVGPVQALIDELEFNLDVSENASYDSLGCSFLDEQFRRAIKDGVIATLDEDLKKSILAAYRVIGRANEKIRGAMASFGPGSIDAKNDALRAVQETNLPIGRAREALLRFLSSDS